MPYTTQAKIEASLPAVDLLAALDDDRDGVADAGRLTTVIEAADGRVDSFLAQAYETPFSPVPAIVAEASLVFVLAGLYRRRGVADEANPWAEREKTMEARLGRIANKLEPLTYETPKAKPAGTVIGQGSLLHSETSGVLA